MGKRSIITGALVLTAANLTTRILGFFYRIYMVNTIGTEGIGLYQLIMPVYMLAWSISSSGFTTTISKYAAQEKAKKQYGNMRRILTQSVIMCLLISVAISIMLYFFSKDIAFSVLNEPRTYLSLKILSIAFPFMAIGSCIRGYFFGIQNSVVPALSQVLEQFVRIITVYVISSFFVQYGLEYACAAATCGIVMGEIISCVFVIISYMSQNNKTPKKKPSISAISALQTITSMAFPLTAARVTSSFLSSIENVLIPQRLALFNTGAISAISVYGELTGMAMPLIQLPSAVIMAISVTLVPALSETQASCRLKDSIKIIEKSIKFATIVGLGFTILFATFPYAICHLIYSKKELGDLLIRLCSICPFLYLQITLNGILNGLGSHQFIFKQNLLSSAINLFFIYFLMPELGTTAFIIGMALSLICTVFMGLNEISNQICIEIKPISVFGKPCLCAVLAAMTSKILLPINNMGLITTLLSIIFMGLFYFLLLLLTKTITKAEMYSFLPKKMFH